MLGAWIWDFSPSIFSLFGREIRWYGLLFALGFLLANYIMSYIYQKEGRDLQSLDKILLYMVVGVVVGARLGHVIFYDPSYYFAQPWKILYVWEGGLASHGGLIGILLAALLYCRHTKQSYLIVLDRIAIVSAIVSACIRLGNFANSEIYGKPTESRYGVVFAKNSSVYLSEQLGAKIKLSTLSSPQVAHLQPISAKLRYDYSVDSTQLTTFLRQQLPLFFASSSVQPHLQLPQHFAKDIHISTQLGHTEAQFLLWGVARHPTQLYEALFYALLFGGLFLWWKKYRSSSLPTGSILGVSMVLLWGFRFTIEFLKERQEEFENPFWLNMGQILSLPLLLTGGLLLLYIYRKKQTHL